MKHCDLQNGSNIFVLNLCHSGFRRFFPFGPDICLLQTNVWPKREEMELMGGGQP